MKKLIVSIIVIGASYTASAQVPEKKKDEKKTPAATAPSEKAISESGVSVKGPKKHSSSSAKTTETTTPIKEPTKKEEPVKVVKKPE